MNKLLKIITLFSLLMLPQLSFSQDTGPRNKTFEKAEKRKEKQKANKEKNVSKHHDRIQSKDTRKRMKKTKKKSKRYKDGKFEEPFYKRWFRKK